jgi:hypothetical protein
VGVGNYTRVRTALNRPQEILPNLMSKVPRHPSPLPPRYANPLKRREPKHVRENEIALLKRINNRDDRMSPRSKDYSTLNTLLEARYRPIYNTSTLNTTMTIDTSSRIESHPMHPKTSPLLDYKRQKRSRSSQKAMDKLESRRCAQEEMALASANISLSIAQRYKLKL